MTLEQVIIQMEIPKPYRHCTFENWQGDAGGKLNDILKAAQERHNILIGDERTGIGKTHLAVAALIHSWFYDLKDKYQYDASLYRFYSIRRLGFQLDLAGIRLEEIIDEVLEHRGCLLDELGAEPERATEKIELVIDELYLKGRQIIITTNLISESLIQKYNPAIIRRVTENGIIVNADWSKRK
ncbi:MAG: hypothetical protein FJY65_12575 [Calditrichaeota bacterium]|nr:hypothetical protein [Calditrichota bacterium]